MLYHVWKLPSAKAGCLKLLLRPVAPARFGGALWPCGELNLAGVGLLIEQGPCAIGTCNIRVEDHSLTQSGQILLRALEYILNHTYMCLPTSALPYTCMELQFHPSAVPVGRRAHDKQPTPFLLPPGPPQPASPRVPPPAHPQLPSPPAFLQPPPQRGRPRCLLPARRQLRSQPAQPVHSP